MSIVAVCLSPTHSMSKPVVDEIKLVTGLGIEGDAHFGDKVQHLSRVKANPDQPNLRQIHLIHTELHQELKAKGFTKGVEPGEMGENITTRDIDILSLPKGTKLELGDRGALIEITGLRNPCQQLNGLENTLMSACRDTDADGRVTQRKAGIMGIVLNGGIVKANDKINIILPEEPHIPLQVV
ncbi:MOSC domain-containing protein [Heterostelium album PN500]|uniref:MOSC domain-containing protein n=1 Tax=Heterostelium pallidum (strain ATCC 26659 / Pp 5 / PN500) TaxID=670386 RepID=D3BU14_HETP5|nr:MOSC domain-containing protein [Heterostelium album PN500]EFA75200.1 MOSC domain-containing protein [Heterostelium album PN500]|eukprot:XP_020427334.1 MOSC domain-containing protein [Heterostelium album PN500]